MSLQQAQSEEQDRSQEGGFFCLIHYPVVLCSFSERRLRILVEAAYDGDVETIVCEKS